MLDELMRRGWPALEECTVDGWLARFAAGVTQRANSVLPLTAPSDVNAALTRVEAEYATRSLPAVFQLGPSPCPADLDTRLSVRGYAYGSPTLVQTAPADSVLAALTPSLVTISSFPDGPWMDLWWQVDGRGDARARAVAHQVLTAGEALYATTSDAQGPTAVARLALVEDWGGLYCLAVRSDARRRGLGAAVTHALVAAAMDRGVAHCWLQVREENTPARRLYASAGFTTVARYHYRTQRT